ncbi:hypothetical protein K9B35_00155 [Sphingomonas sp. R647]|uniref:Rap1a/Tai family immunity protein n=1 Tax=Sphingomonas sp. R647 TaxID=2875233 RepID=UPI001CD20E97|nr:Rap1a/Tai family immunity protein [Sphingomonas sp. R647]MCA1196366.1 hypothetical protein [Sphingomonas sp. R647]
MLLALLLGSLQPQPAQAPALFTAGALKDRCESTDPADASFCFAYIVGVYDAVRAYESWLKMREFCAPGNLVQADLRKAFIDYLAENPGYRAGEAASVVVVSLKTRFPCQDQPKPGDEVKIP